MSATGELLVASPPEYRVNVAEYRIARDRGVIATFGLGSCVAIMLYDAGTQIGGMAHILLPSREMSRRPDQSAKFAETAVPLLLAEMRHAGALTSASGLVAKIVGGASMFAPLLSSGGINMGERNLIATRAALAAAGVSLVAEDVGGGHGRNVYFDVATGAVRVRSLHSTEICL
jgi:chemotaxis protein CheD